MRKTAWVLLILFVFSIPWEYSLDVGAPFGNVARILGLLAMLTAGMAILAAGRFRKCGSIHWLALAFYLWSCCTYMWASAPDETLTHLRGYAQEMVLIWLVWELVESWHSLRLLLRAWLAGSWVLAILTIAGFAISSGPATEQVRFVAVGQDPNDVARYLGFGFPIAGHLINSSRNRIERWLWLLYYPAGFAAVLLTASRSGLLIAVVVLAGCGIAALRRHAKGVIATGILTGSVLILLFAVAPKGTFERLGTTAELWEAGDLNQRVNIWSAGWRAFEAAPMVGHGAGSFVRAAELAPEDTAHNTAISILVEVGLCGLALAAAVVVFAVRAIRSTSGPLRFTVTMLMLVWALSTLSGTVWENRLTWLLFGVAAAGSRISRHGTNDPEPMLDGRDFCVSGHLGDFAG